MKNALLIAMIFMTACTARRMPLSSEKAAHTNGRDKYMAYCQKCHPAGESGLGPGLNHNPAPGFIKRFQVRHGLGAMPAFKKDVISKNDLTDIMKFMKEMKHSEKLPS